MLIGGILLGLVLGLLAGGSIWHLGSVRLERVALLFGAVIVRFATEAAIGAGIEIADTFRLPLFGLAYAMLLAGLWGNRSQPGLNLAFVGILGNAIAIVVNGGYMPIWEPSLEAAGLERDDIRSVFHTILPATLDANFLLRGGPLGDVIPIPFPFVQNVASIGDLFLSAGLAFFLFATVLRTPQELDEAEVEAIRTRLVGLARTRRMPGAADGIRGETGLAAGLAEAAVLERPLVLGASGAGLAAPALAPLPEMELADAGEAGAPAAPRAAPEIIERARRHPYVRLALNPSFSALWAGQLISLFGDRIHQIALAFLVYDSTDSAIATALVFLVATLPNLLFSPIAGTFVDRWDQREVLIVSDILRAALILLVPVLAVVNLFLVYPLVFLVTTISIFFRPARVAILPRLVREDELLPANSALWVGETLADVVGYPLAGLFVAFLGSALPLAFWIDAATYIASAALLWTIVVPPVARTLNEATGDGRRSFVAEMGMGWGFLRRERTLLANTLQATVAQFTLGILLALTAVYARDTIESSFDPKAVYAFLETGIGVGNLIGGFVIGLIGARFARGRTVIVGYSLAGLCIALIGMTDQLPLAIGLMTGMGVANMIFVIPSQTMFQERTPPELMGRVVGFRFALVFGSMTLAMGVGGVLGEIFGPAPVIAVFGLLTMVAGLAGLFVPAVRDA
jgi:DHA3 family macrolide efflux protein-like MFS transporter